MFDNETKERSKKFEALVNLILLPALSTEHIDQEIIDKLKSKCYFRVLIIINPNLIISHIRNIIENGHNYDTFMSFSDRDVWKPNLVLDEICLVGFGRGFATQIYNKIREIKGYFCCL